jgi:hypothetical protein
MRKRFWISSIKNCGMYCIMDTKKGYSTLSVSDKRYGNMVVKALNFYNDNKKIGKNNGK